MKKKSRAKERIFSFRNTQHRWDPKNQRPELWSLYNTRKNKGESIRVFPLSNWTELDIWQYIYFENIEIVPLYFAAPRPVVERDGMLIMVDDDRMPLRHDEIPRVQMVRFRTLGCYPLTGAIPSNADTLPKIIYELMASRQSERQGRAIDHDSQASMEKKRKKDIFDMYESSISNELREHPEYTADFLAAHEEKSLLRFITCGSVDDGKSTLIGRILFETNMIFDNEFATLQRDSQKFGTTGENIDFALLVDGLSSEREQGITIDVAYRFFATPQRKFIVADTPGHEQYTRNMATGASTADLAVVMIDSRKGVLTQTKRHSLIVSLLGVKQVVVAVNKMDLVGYDYQQFLEIERSYRQFAENLGFEQIDVIPVSALRGDNITAPSSGMPWYHGKTLLRTLECAKTKVNQRTDEFRFPVQWVNRPNPGFRGYAGTVASGNIKPGDAVRIQPSGKTTRVKQIVAYSGEQVMADTGESITLTLDDEIDVSRGDVITNIQSPCEVADQFQATILWMSDRPMVRGRQYLLKCATQNALCTPNAPKYQLDVNTGEHKAADQLELNQIGVCDIYLNKEIVLSLMKKIKRSAVLF